MPSKLDSVIRLRSAECSSQRPRCVAAHVVASERASAWSLAAARRHHPPPLTAGDVVARRRRTSNVALVCLVRSCACSPLPARAWCVAVALSLVARRHPSTTAATRAERERTDDERARATHRVHVDGFSIATCRLVHSMTSSASPTGPPNSALFAARIASYVGDIDRICRPASFIISSCYFNSRLVSPQRFETMTTHL